MAEPLHHSLRDIRSLENAEIDRMFFLMGQHYDCVERSSFEVDLGWKDQVILLLDGDGIIQGFSTLALNPKGTGGPDYDIFYSGDTIIDRKFWGTQELVRGFSIAAGKASKSDRRLLWLLLSKGHRTYSYLPLFAHRYFPAALSDRDAIELKPVIDETAATLFGDGWFPDLGVVRFQQSLGQLKPELAEGTHERANQRHVEFFLRQNPGFSRGDELVCMAELNSENLRRHVRRCFVEGAGIEISAAA